MCGAVVDQQHEDRDGERSQLDPVLECLHDGDRVHPAGVDVQRHDHHDYGGTDPLRLAGDFVQGQAGTLQLRHQVKPADDDDESGADSA